MPRRPGPSYLRRKKTLSPREGPALFKEAEDQIRTKAVLLRLTPSEHATLKDLAQQEDMTVICWIREVIRDSIKVAD